MKKFNLKNVLLLMVLVLTIISCKKDNNNAEPSTSNLVGTWNCTSVNYTGTSVTEVLGQSITTDYTGEGYDVDFTYTFSENPNLATSEGSFGIKLTSTILGQSTVQNIPGNSFNYTGNWSLAGDKITITYEGESQEATIVSLTDTNLVLNIIDETVTVLGTSTMTETTNMTIVLSK
ncbi:MAG: hypothetical protein GXO88_01415 [Chlorobi bacterium]|nr:hypothetical protein [Chlorobiota bacterium]